MEKLNLQGPIVDKELAGLDSPPNNWKNKEAPGQFFKFDWPAGHQQIDAITHHSGSKFNALLGGRTASC